MTQAVRLPAGVHVPVMPAEVLAALRPAPGEVVVDCTVGGAGHAELILRTLVPAGRLIGIDRDAEMLSKATSRLREAGCGAETFVPVSGDFRDLLTLLSAIGIERVDGMLVDLGVSSMQAASRDRGFNHRVPGLLDMRMDRSRGETAAELIARVSEADLADLLVAFADEPHAAVIAKLIKEAPVLTAQVLERRVRVGLERAALGLPRPTVRLSVRRTFQALRIAVNDEFRALEALLAQVPRILRPGGRIVVLTFHSGEDRRVKRAFRHGQRHGLYTAVSKTVTRSTVVETRANRRSSSAKLRWAVRSPNTPSIADVN